MGNKHPEASLCAHIAQKQLRRSFCAIAQISDPASGLCIVKLYCIGSTNFSVRNPGQVLG